MAELSPERALFATRGTSSAAFPASCGALATPTRAHLSRRRDKVKDLVAFRSRAGHGTGSDRGVGDLFDDRQRPDRGLRQAPSCQDHGQVRRGLGGTSEPASAPAGTVRPDRGERPDPSVVLRGISRHGPHPVCAARRLKEVRLALRDAHPDKVKVAEVAHRFGFTRLGRFAGTYRATFGEAPSTTLQRTPGVPLTGP